MLKIVLPRGLAARAQAVRYSRTVRSRALSTPNRDTGGTEEFRVVLDRTAGTIYIDQPLAEALGWSPEQGQSSVDLTLSGWAPHYFAVTRKDTDADLLARATVESSTHPVVRGILENLKDR